MSSVATLAIHIILLRKLNKGIFVSATYLKLFNLISRKQFNSNFKDIINESALSFLSIGLIGGVCAQLAPYASRIIVGLHCGW